MMATLSGLRGLFRSLYVFGDSISDYGSRAAAAQRDVFAPDASPPWSGVTYSNTSNNWQTYLAESLGVAPASTSKGNPPVSPYALYANSLIVPPSLVGQTSKGRSYAIGGATSGRINLNQLSHPKEAPGLDLVDQGMATLMGKALGSQKLRFNSDDLVVVWGGGNDFLVGFAMQSSLQDVIDGMVSQLGHDLETALRFGQARQVVLAAVAPIRGQVDGVPYQAPFLTGILLQAASGQAPDWLKEWARQINAGVVDQFRLDVSQMVAAVQKKFPYANIINFEPEFQAQYQKFGSKLGNFADYGITDTLSYAQFNPATKPAEANSFAYFDPIHPTGSAHHMLGNALGLELESSTKEIAASRLTTNLQPFARLVKGTDQNDRIQAKFFSSVVRSGRGNDWLTGQADNVLLEGQEGNDVLNGGIGRQRLSGGPGADFFGFSAADTNGTHPDVILDFNASQGDRLGINAVLGLDASLAGSGWTFIGEQAFSGSPAQLRFAGSLLSGDLDGDGKADLRIRLEGLGSFDPAWIS